MQYLLTFVGDGLIERDLRELISARREGAKENTYEVWIWTSDLRAAGTDSNIFIQVLSRDPHVIHNTWCYTRYNSNALS